MLINSRYFFDPVVIEWESRGNLWIYFGTWSTLNIQTNSGIIGDWSFSRVSEAHALFNYLECEQRWIKYFLCFSIAMPSNTLPIAQHDHYGLPQIRMVDIFLWDQPIIRSQILIVITIHIFSTNRYRLRSRTPFASSLIVFNYRYSWCHLRNLGVWWRIFQWMMSTNGYKRILNSRIAWYRKYKCKEKNQTQHFGDACTLCLFFIKC